MRWGLNKDSLNNFDCHFTFRCLYPIIIMGDVDSETKENNEMDHDGGVNKHDQIVLQP